MKSLDKWRQRQGLQITQFSKRSTKLRILQFRCTLLSSISSTTLYKYRIDGRLGKGAFGTVYKEEDVETCELVALKITVLDGRNATIPDGIKLEIDLLPSLQHGNIVTLKGYFIENGEFHTIVKFVFSSMNYIFHILILYCPLRLVDK